MYSQNHQLSHNLSLSKFANKIMGPDIVSDETPMPKEVNPDDVAGEVSLQLCEGVGSPELGGLLVPTLPPF